MQPLIRPHQITLYPAAVKKKERAYDILIWHPDSSYSIISFMNHFKTDKTNTGASQKAIPVIKILFFVVLALSLAGLVCFSSIDHSSPADYKDPYFIEDWNVTSPEGRVFTAGSTCRNENAEKGSFTMVSHLPDTIAEGSDFCFIVGGNVAIFINGELRKDFIESRDVIVPGGCVKRFYMRVPLSPADSGAEIKFVRSGTSRGGYIYQNTCVAGDNDFFAFMLSRYGLSLLLDEILLMFSVVTVIASLIMMLLYKRRIAMLYGGLSILVIAGWLITNSFLYPFLYGHYHVDGVMNYMLCLMMPFSLIFYLDILQNGRYRRIMNWVLGLAAANLIVWPILHFTCIFSFPKALLTIDIFLGVELFVVAGILVTDLIRGKIKDYKYTAIGYAGFISFGLAELAAITFIPLLNNDMLMLAGLAFMLTLTVVQQMSDLRKIREEGQRALDLSEAKTKFLASMSHEIRTPINAILGMNEMILRENKDPVIGEYAGSVKSSGQMLLMLVNDVLDFSKIESGKMQITNAEFSFSSALRNIMPMLNERADAKDLKLHLVISDEVPDGQISDEFRIRQILINLINNAIKYTDTGSVTLNLGGSYTDDDSYMLKIIVKDTGRGISEEDQKHLFEAFTRADERKNRNIEGTGLGLAIVKSIIDSMSGEITVRSKYGEGSEFIVQLPVKVSDRTPLQADYDKHTTETESEKGGSDYLAPEASILAVDDNNSNLKIVRLFLKRVGIVPELCDSGTKAIELCRKKRYDLILLDHMMPDPDGIKTLGIIKSDETSQNKDTPVIVLTANALAGSAKLYLDAGFSDYLTKPIDSSLLEETIKKYLPAEKILPADTILPSKELPPVKTEKESPDTGEYLPIEFMPAGETDNTGTGSSDALKEKLEKIEGLDYRTAIGYVGNDPALLEEIIETIASESDEKIETMRECIASQDWEGYVLTAHTIKSHMASIGLSRLSEQAKKHEFAGRDNDIEFIKSDCEAFFEAYHDVCSRLK